MDAFFGTASQRGPRSRTRRGQDAMIRIEVELEEAAFGTTKDIQVDTAVVCNTCNGEGAAPGTSAQTWTCAAAAVRSRRSPGPSWARS
ncbi:Chaperone protein DnaJ [Streptomyces fumanus]